MTAKTGITRPGERVVRNLLQLISKQPGGNATSKPWTQWLSEVELTLVKQLEEVAEARHEAENWARMGLRAKGLHILRNGLVRAEQTGEPWKDQLVDRWKEALENFEQSQDAVSPSDQAYLFRVSGH